MAICIVKLQTEQNKPYKFWGSELFWGYMIKEFTCTFKILSELPLHHKSFKVFLICLFMIITKVLLICKLLTCTFSSSRTHTCTHTHTLSLYHSHTHTHTHTHALFLKHTHTHTHTHTLSLSLSLSLYIYIYHTHNIYFSILHLYYWYLIFIQCLQLVIIKRTIIQ